MAALQGQFQFRPSILPLPGEPTEEFSQLMDSRIEAFDKGVEEEVAFNNLLATFQVAPGYEGVRNELALNAENRLGQLAEKYKGAYEDPRFQREALAIQRELIKNPAYSTLAQNKVNFDLYNQQRIENPNQYDFNPFDKHVQKDIESGKLSVFTPHREDILSVNDAADNAIEPFLSYIETRPEYSTMTRRNPETGEVIGYSFIGREKVDFKITDAWDPNATEEQRKEAKNMLKLLRQHSLDAFKREDAGDQFYRKRRNIDGELDQSVIDQDAMDIIIDRFPGVKSFKERNMGTISTNTGGGNDTPPERPLTVAVNRPVIKRDDVPLEEAYETLELQVQDAIAKTQGGEENYKKALQMQFTADEDGNIIYNGTSTASPDAAASIEGAMSQATQAKNLASSLIGINTSIARMYNIPEEIWTDMSDWNSLDKVALAKHWYGEDFDTYVNSPENEPIGLASLQEDLANDEDAQTMRENRAAQALLEKDYTYESMIRSRNQKAQIAIEQNSTSFPYIQFGQIQNMSVSDKRSLDGVITNTIKNNLESVDIYNTDDWTADKSDDYIKNVREDNHAIELISFIPAGARKMDSQGKILGEYDPSEGEIEAWIGEADDDGNIIGEKEKIILRGVNINKLLGNKVNPNDLADWQLRAGVANIIESGMIPEGQYYDLTANDINLAINATNDYNSGAVHNLTYTNLMNELWPQGRANLPTITPGTTSPGTDELNLSIRRERSQQGQDVYTLYAVEDGVRRPLKIDDRKTYAVGEQAAPDELTKILQDYYIYLINDIYGQENE